MKNNLGKNGMGTGSVSENDMRTNGMERDSERKPPIWKGQMGLPLALAMVLAAFGGWHWLDVYSAAVNSGGRWLLGGYGLLLACGLLAAVALGWLFCREGSGSLERIYPAAGLLLGLLYLLVLPPLSAPDEISHYISAYQLSSRMLGQPSNDIYGRVLVRNQDAWIGDMEGIYEYVADENGNLQVVPESSDGSVVLGETLDESVYEIFHELGAGGQYGSERLRELGEGFSSTMHPPVVTTPFAYVPQALGIGLARLLGLGSVILLYLGRLGNLLFFVGMTWLAMRRLPFGKEVLFGVALLPMTLHLSASFSYDVMIMACIFCLTAICLDLAFQKERVTWQDVAVLMVLMAVSGPCKMVYAVMMGLCLLIPVRKFGGWGRWALSALAVGGAWAVAMYLVNSQTIATYATETESYVQWAGEPGYSLTLLLHQPVQAVRMFYQTILWQAAYYHQTMIGAYLGNLDPVLDVPYLLVLLFMAGLLVLSMKKPGESLALNGGRRIWVGVLCAGCAAATMLSMLIAWTPLSSNVINGVQGRYFLPFLPVLLMSWKNDLAVLTRNCDRKVLYMMCCANIYVVLRLFAVVSMRL